MAVSGARLTFEPEWRTTLFTLLFVPLMVGLGFWQLQRAEEKAALSASWEQRQAQRPAPPAELLAGPEQLLPYAPIRLIGQFVPGRYFLLDNRIHQGRFGYEVLGILRLAEHGGVALVNRGWIAGDPARLALPEVPEVNGSVSLQGHVYIAPGTPYLLEDQVLQPGWPKRIQAVDMEMLIGAMSALGDDGVFPHLVRIKAGQPGALVVDWKVINVSPAKHQGYAVQWFAMASVLFIFYLLRSSNVWQLLRAGTGK